MHKCFLALVVMLFSGLTASAQPELERQLIRSMAGCYTVTFNFAETFSDDTAYRFHDRYHAAGTEYVFVLAETPTTISLQHLLITRDSMVIKHWRQDWVYQNTRLLTYTNKNEWQATTLTPEQAKGTWTQKVYQVDDGPRYESYGTWIHAAGKHYWESVCDAPLPRRDNTKRNDYNIMRRHSRIEVSNNGWFLEQDNEKIVRSTTGDKLLCWEKGMETFTPTQANCQAAINYWEKNKNYWEKVRKVWEEVAGETTTLKMEDNPGDAKLWYELVTISKETPAAKQYKAIQEAIRSFIKNT